MIQFQRAEDEADFLQSKDARVHGDKVKHEYFAKLFDNLYGTSVHHNKRFSTAITGNNLQPKNQTQVEIYMPARRMKLKDVNQGSEVKNLIKLYNDRTKQEVCFNFFRDEDIGITQS